MAPHFSGITDIKTFKDSVPVGGNTIFGAYPLDVDVNYARKEPPLMSGPGIT
jgi:hypothetical protein